MKLFNNKRTKRTPPTSMSVGISDWDIICPSGYRNVADCPEVVAGVKKIADQIASMTIYLMVNDENGDRRIKSELSKKIDVNPCANMTHFNWVSAIVMNLLLYGKGNSVVRFYTHNGYLSNMIPIPAWQVSFLPSVNSYDYQTVINGEVVDNDSIMHFVYNPDDHYLWKGKGLQASLKLLADTLSQANETKNAFMSSKWKPSVIVKVDGMVDEFSSPEGRRKLLESYMETNGKGEPWLIPADQFSVEQVRPLSLADLAINDTVKMDKKTVASLLGVPSFVLGEGKFDKDEWNNFINSTIKPIAKSIEQEMTKKLIASNDMYLKFNVSSLYEYDYESLVDVFGTLHDKGIVTGNEVRNKFSLEPKEGLDELRILENYIPATEIGNQKKLEKKIVKKLKKGDDNED